MYRQITKKIIIVALAVLVALCAPLTASAFTYAGSTEDISSFGFKDIQFETLDIYYATSTDSSTWEWYNASDITFTKPSYSSNSAWFEVGINSTRDYHYNMYIFEFSLKNGKATLENPNHLKFDIEIGDGYTLLESMPNKCFNILADGSKIEAKTSFDGERTFSFDFGLSGTKDIPEKYCFQFWGTSRDGAITFNLKNYSLEVKTPLDIEKEEAESSGNDGIDGVTGALPYTDFSGLQNSLDTLVQNMMYNGTDCVWTFPALKIPAISGVTPEIKLTDDRDIDLGAWVRKMPSAVLMVIQACCSIGVVLFIIYELYSFIIFCMTLRNNQVGKDEESED